MHAATMALAARLLLLGRAPARLCQPACLHAPRLQAGALPAGPVQRLQLPAGYGASQVTPSEVGGAAAVLRQWVELCQYAASISHSADRLKPQRGLGRLGAVRAALKETLQNPCVCKEDAA